MIDAILQAFATPEINIQEENEERQLNNRLGKLLNYLLTRVTFPTNENEEDRTAAVQKGL